MFREHWTSAYCYYALLFCIIRSKKSNKEVKKRGGGFCKLCSLSPELQKFIGVPELARTEVYCESSGEVFLFLFSTLS